MNVPVVGYFETYDGTFPKNTRNKYKMISSYRTVEYLYNGARDYRCSQR